MRRKGYPTMDPKSEWHKWVYDPGAFKWVFLHGHSVLKPIQFCSRQQTHLAKSAPIAPQRPTATKHTCVASAGNFLQLTRKRANIGSFGALELLGPRRQIGIPPIPKGYKLFCRSENFNNENRRTWFRYSTFHPEKSILLFLAAKHASLWMGDDWW